ncbi:MAG: tetratricopeptide repeat protein [Candidatus Ozemobacteraceae bacterium]
MVPFVSIEERDLANQHFDRGLSFDIRGKLGEAIVEMEKAIACDSGFAEAYNKLGDYYMKKGWLQKAIDMFKKSSELKPEVENSHFDLGCAYAHMGRYSEALYEFQKSLSIDPKHFEIYGRMGHVYLQIGMFGEAIDNLKRALVKDQGDVMARYNLGLAFLKVNRATEAHTQFEKVAEHYTTLTRVKDRYAEGHFYIGRCYFFQQRFDRAVEHLKKAVEFDTDAIDFHYSFGMLYSDGDAFAALAEACSAVGDKKAARDAVQRALNLEPQNERFIAVQRAVETA